MITVLRLSLTYGMASAACRAVRHLVTCLVLLLATVSTASAHATLVSSTPAAGSIIGQSPTVIQLVFTEQMAEGMGSIELIGAGGQVIRLVTVIDPRNAYALLARPPELPSGYFRVVWKTVSADGHAVTGSFVFRKSVPGEAASLGSAAGDEIPPVPVAAPKGIIGVSLAGAPLVPGMLRGLAMLSLLSLCGVLIVARVDRDSRPPGRVERVTSFLAVIAPMAIVAHVASWVAVVVTGEAEFWNADFVTVLSGSAGRIEVIRLLLTILAAWALLLARRRMMAALFAAAAVIAGGGIGHPAAIDPLLAIPGKAAHLFAAALWIGALLSIVLSDMGDAEKFILQTRRASAIALGAVVVVTLSGILQSVLFLESPSDLATVPYGRYVIAKAVGLAALVAFGAYHRLRLVPAISGAAGPATLRRSVQREILLMGLVFVVGSLMAYTPTPNNQTALTITPIGEH